MERDTQPCFMSDHEGFCGSIKNSTRDFVVTELDVQGRPVTSTGRPEVAEVRQGSRKAGTAGVTTVVQNGDGVLSQEGFDLSAILGSSVHEALGGFASRTVACVEEQKEDTEMALGTFPEKQQRASVHRAVRHNYPFLMTVTRQTGILVKVDPDFRELSQLVSEGEAEDFFRFIDAKVPGSVFTFLPDDSKEHRTSVHHFISRRFGKLVETKSFAEQDQTAIAVRLREKGNQGKKSGKRSASDREEQAEIYSGFTLKKENLETLEAISYMAAVLGVLPSDFSYAGIKDKRAITYQSMVVKKISAERLLEKASEFERRGMQLSNIHPASEPLRLGRLQGNHFDLVIRDLKPHGKCSSSDLEALVKAAVENVKARGFVNFYGPQRFGNSQTVQADQVGLALLKEDMVTAVRLFLSPEEGEDLQNKAKRHFLRTGNAKESLLLMPAYKARERLMLRALHRYGSGQEGCGRAWLSLPHGMRVFYLHAYCSRLWNEAASYRLNTLPHWPVQGDLVCTRPQRDASATEESDAAQVHVVTHAEEKDNAFSLKQVVLPMPGNSVKYPENVLGKWYQDRLAQDSLSSCRFRITSLKLNVPGCYRPLLAHPHDVTYSLCVKEEPQVTGPSPPHSTASLTLSFDLDSSCYATVCLREIMKCEP
ncbi:pseudouridylate synthase 7 homolog-like protein [Pygocentrus nattereri]|uniref:Pseudouridylate synthase PUS7L n=1 Tax=Pygocentrus nattereri TaxID=42514 RepID=A0A3B4D3N2_PYGNA|nr:pseudouridylate synthase 7 homolog-like protein [Pygocentrus nattereri]